MNPNRQLGHRGSMQEYSNDFYNSTSHSGSTGRSASTGHVQYQYFPSQSHFVSGIGEQRISNQVQYSQSGTWNNGAALPQRCNQSQANGFDPGELRQFSLPEDVEPWTGAAVRSPYNNHQQHFLPSWPPLGAAGKAHTVAAGPTSPSVQRLQPFPTRPPLTSQDSGFQSRNSSSQDLSKYPLAGYEFAVGLTSAFGPSTALTVPASVKSESRLQTNGKTARQKKIRASIEPCHICGKVLKNHSDARKHQLQHDKPFTCEILSCSRSQGFATKNDLQRHRKSVHLARPSVGKETGYICQGCLPGSPGCSPKWWPRLDNFKAHIDRKHKDLNMEQLIDISEAPRPENAVSESGYASQPPLSVVAEDRGYQHDLASPLDIPMSRRDSQHGDLTLFGLDHTRFDQLAGIGEGTFTDPFGNRGSIPQNGPTSGSVGTGLAAIRDAALEIASPVDSMMESPATQRVSVSSIHINQFGFSDARLSNSVPWSAPPLKQPKIDWISKQASLVDQDNLHANRTENGDYACHHCDKIKKRECDLRKHIKRHTRPYGCTFPNCYKRFGSRNDWKRHENSQHFLQEMWRCEAKTMNGEVCGKLVYHEDTFINHLQRRHGFDIKSIKMRSHIKMMHLGREGHHHFWCGFCNMLVPQEDKQSDGMQESAWVMRFNHIGNHFDKHNANIDNWICIEHNKKKGLITKEDRKKAKSRLRNGKAADDSDLGDDGIPCSSVSKYSGSAFHVGNLPTVVSTCTTNKRKWEDADMDADGVSDSGW